MSLRRPAIRRIALVIVASLAALRGAPAAAQDTLFGPPGAGRFGPPDRSASQAAREELTAARASLVRARIATAQLVRATEAALRAGGEFRSLQTAAARASGDYHAARRPPLASLARDAEYVRLDRRREAIRREIRRIAAADREPLPRVLPLAYRAMETGQRMTRSEVIALALDPNVEEARAAMTTAFARLRHVGATYRDRVAQEPVVVMAREDLAAARERVAEANRQLVRTLRTEAAADRRRDTRDYGG